MEPPRPPSGRWLAAGLLAAVFAASALLPLTPLAGRTVCLFRHLSGLPCPGCGLGRSFVALTHGRAAEAFSHHALGPLVYGVMALLLVRLLAEALLRRRLRPWLPPRLAGPLLWAGVGLLLVAWGARLAGVLPSP